MKICYSLLALVLFSAGCKKEFNNRTMPAAETAERSAISVTALPVIDEYRVAPEATDPAITTQTIGDPVQYAYLPQNPLLRKDRLFVFIPGTISTPSSYNDVCQTAAYSGYYSFAVAYSNISPVEAYAGLNPDDHTVENILEEFLTGNNTSNRLTVTRANSFENRIIKMIAFMDSLRPDQNWKQFLTQDQNLNWKKISVAGHSQGSDHAMYMSKKRTLFRAGFFAGPGNFKLRNGSYPSFMQEPGLTPPANLYGFNHTGDRVRLWRDVRETWQVIGVPGAPEDVDDKKVNGAHQLTTSVPMNDEHSGIVQDDPTPDDNNGNPIYALLWRYMCFP